jgi:hypothetical protein
MPRQCSAELPMINGYRQLNFLNMELSGEAVSPNRPANSDMLHARCCRGKLKCERSAERRSDPSSWSHRIHKQDKELFNEKHRM